MPDEDKTFSGSFVLDFRIWWRQAHTLYKTNKIKYKHADYFLYVFFIHLPLKYQMNRVPAMYAVLCDCQMFPVNVIASLVTDWKTAV